MLWVWGTGSKNSLSVFDLAKSTPSHSICIHRCAIKELRAAIKRPRQLIRFTARHFYSCWRIYERLAWPWPLTRTWILRPRALTRISRHSAGRLDSRCCWFNFGSRLRGSRDAAAAAADASCALLFVSFLSACRA